MGLDLRSVFETEGSKKEISEQLDEREYELFGTKPFVERISVRGEVANRAGVVTLSVQVSFPLRVACDRCLEEFTRQYDYTFTHTLVQQLQDEWAGLHPGGGRHAGFGGTDPLRHFAGAAYQALMQRRL